MKQVAAACAEPSWMCIEQDSRHLVRLREHQLSASLDDECTAFCVDTRGDEGDRPETLEDSARAAINDLLAYRRAFEPVLGKQTEAYGIGIAWGADLEPKETAEIVLCTPDTIPGALAVLGLLS